jgi:hypothetical protein
MPKGWAESTVHLCEACEGLSSKGSKATIVRTDLRMASLLNLEARRDFASRARRFFNLAFLSSHRFPGRGELVS